MPRPSLVALWAAVRGVVGAEEVAVALALVVLTAGLWPSLGWSALVVPGAILVWMFLPARVPFIDRPAVDERKRH